MAEEEGEDETLFAVTKRVREAVSLMNGVDETKLSVVVRRLAKVVGDRVQSAFNEEEVEQLQEHLCLASTELTTVLEGISYVLEKTAYSLVKPEDLSAQLQAVGLLPSHSRAVAGVWEQEAKGVLSRLRATSLGGTPKLKTTEWQLQVEAARSDMARIAEPRTILQLGLDKSGQGSDVTVEMSQEGLTDFLRQLDAMQKQLDSLS